MNYEEMSIEDLKKNYYVNAINFFSWNSGKNTPNILLNLSKNIETLNTQIQKANEASTSLSKSLNRITLWGVIISGLIALSTIFGIVF